MLRCEKGFFGSQRHPHRHRHYTWMAITVVLRTPKPDSIDTANARSVLRRRLAFHDKLFNMLSNFLFRWRSWIFFFSFKFGKSHLNRSPSHVPVNRSFWIIYGWISEACQSLRRYIPKVTKINGRVPRLLFLRIMPACCFFFKLLASWSAEHRTGQL